jgi:hypothetical protein
MLDDGGVSSPSRSMRSPIKKGMVPFLLALVGLIWISVIAAGSAALMKYEYGAATPGESPSQWPVHSRIQPPHDKFVLVMVAHPDCPCTRASVAQLEELMARLSGKLVAYVLFSKPEAGEQEVRASELWKKAEKIPGVAVLFDRQAAESAGFGGLVSGETMLYDRAGRLVFTGGLTSARGREGHSAGTDAVLMRVSENPNASAHTPVFGCSLRDPETKELREDSSWKKR